MHQSSPKLTRRDGQSHKAFCAYKSTKSLFDTLIKEAQMCQQNYSFNSDSDSISSKTQKNLKSPSKKYLHKESRNTKTVQTQINKKNVKEKTNNKNKNSELNKNKFKKILINRPISRNSQNVESVIQNLSPKASAFYKFGMKGLEKDRKLHRRIYSDVLNLPEEKMKGTMCVGELWTNQMTSKYLKLNKVSMNKVKFFDRLKDFKVQKQRKEREKELDSTQLISSVREFSLRSQRSFESLNFVQSLKSIKRVQSNKTAQSTKSIKRSEKSLFKVTLEKSLQEIREKADEEHQRNIIQGCWKDIKNLQHESQCLHKIWHKYFGKMLEIN